MVDLKRFDDQEQAVYFHSRERRRSLAGMPELFRGFFLAIPTTPVPLAQFPDSAAPITLKTAIRITGATPTGLIFEVGDGTTALALWIDDTKISVRAGDTGVTAAVGEFDNTASLPDTLELEIVASVRPGDGRVRLWLNGTERARATATNGELPNGAFAASNGAFAAAAVGGLPADVTQTGAPSNFEVIEPLSVYHGQVPRHFV